jgi:hypothetical protein
MTAIASGIRSAVSAPYDAAKSALAKIRRLLPHSDALEGPLSTLTRSGSAMLEAFSSGIARASRLPSEALRQAFGAAKSMALPTMVAGTWALTPSTAGAVPRPVAPIVTNQGIESSAADPRQSQLLSATRGTLGNGRLNDAGNQNLQPIFQAILAKLDALGDRPIDVSVTTNLDGRKIAQAVYKDMRERKVRNYEPA